MPDFLYRKFKRHEDLSLNAEVDHTFEYVAKLRYAYADVMLEVRNG